MNKTLFHICAIVALAATTLFASCSREETMGLVVPAESILVAMPGETGTTTFDSSNITSLTPTSVPEGWTVDEINMYKSTITVTAPSSFDNEEVESGTLSLKGYTPTGSTKSVDVYLAIVPAEVDYTHAPANCYVACKPKTRYIFDPMRGGNGSVELATAEIKLLWQTKDDLVQYLDMRDGCARFYLSPDKDDDGNELDTVVPGNALVGAYDANGELIWSWHIWVTNNDPMAAENTFVIGGKTMMNQNLGADNNNEGEANGDAIGRSYGLYYQWGRKDPLPGPHDWNFSLNYDDVLYNHKGYEVKLEYVASSEGGSIEWCNVNPLSVVIGNPDNAYDWISNGHDDALWSASSKTNNDPCPAGWRVPEGGYNGGVGESGMPDGIWAKAGFTRQGLTPFVDGESNMLGKVFSTPLCTPATWYPAAGSIEYNTGKLCYVGVDGVYHSTSAFGGTDAHVTGLLFNYLPNSGGHYIYCGGEKFTRAGGASVRCCKE